MGGEAFQLAGEYLRHGEGLSISNQEERLKKAQILIFVIRYICLSSTSPIIEEDTTLHLIHSHGHFLPFDSKIVCFPSPLFFFPLSDYEDVCQQALEEEVQRHYHKEPLITENEEAKETEDEDEDEKEKSLRNSRDQKRSSATTLIVPPPKSNTSHSAWCTKFFDDILSNGALSTVVSFVSTKKSLIIKSSVISVAVLVFLVLLTRKNLFSVVLQRLSFNKWYTDLMDLLDSAFSVDYNTRRRRQLRRSN